MRSLEVCIGAAADGLHRNPQHIIQRAIASVDTRTEQRKCQCLHPVLSCKLHRGRVRLRQQLVTLSRAAHAPVVWTDGEDDTRNVEPAKVLTAGLPNDGGTPRADADLSALVQQRKLPSRCSQSLSPPCSYRSVHAAASQRHRVGRVDDGVANKVRHRAMADTQLATGQRHLPHNAHARHQHALRDGLRPTSCGLVLLPRFRLHHFTACGQAPGVFALRFASSLVH
mmetsp:Transcript_625/g.2095  ORF Transcript_625/g.2095 Transcript_625/m.2095 type:complete len:226 (-) Transcript_625:98-775(-)